MAAAGRGTAKRFPRLARPSAKRGPRRVPIAAISAIDRRCPNSVLNRPPVIGFFPIIQVPDASDMRNMALTFSPVDGFMLGFESAEHMVHMILDDIVLDGAAVGAAFGPRFYVYACRDRLSSSVTMADLRHSYGS
jgi:hypothetical protein